MPSRISGSGREALSNVQEALPDTQEWSGDPHEFARGRDALPDVREWSGVPSGCPEVVGRLSRIFARVVGRSSRISGSGR